MNTINVQHDRVSDLTSIYTVVSSKVVIKLGHTHN